MKSCPICLSEVIPRTRIPFSRRILYNRTKEASICKDSYTYFKLPDMHQSDPEGHTLTEELLAFDYKPTLAAWDVHYVEYEARRAKY